MKRFNRRPQERFVAENIPLLDTLMPGDEVCIKPHSYAQIKSEGEIDRWVGTVIKRTKRQVTVSTGWGEDIRIGLQYNTEIGGSEYTKHEIEIVWAEGANPRRLLTRKDLEDRLARHIAKEEKAAKYSQLKEILEGMEGRNNYTSMSDEVLEQVLATLTVERKRLRDKFEAKYGKISG